MPRDGLGSWSESMNQEIRLKPPAGAATDEPKRMMFDAVRASPLSSERMAALEKEVKRALEDSRTNTQTMRRRLNDLNDMLEGIAQEVDYPFPNASNVDVKMAVGTVRTLRAIMVRALFPDPDRGFVVSIDRDELRDDANVAEDAFNWNAAHENNLIEAIKDAIVPTFRDGISFLQGVWDRRAEKVIDYKSYATPDEFLVDYPDPKAAGISEQKFTEILTHLTESDTSLDATFDNEMIKKDSAEFSIVSLARFYWYPLSAKSLEDCEVYGVRMEESEATMLRKKKTKEYDPAAVDECLSAVREGASVVDLWDRSRDFIEGISRQNEATKRKDFENFRLVMTMDLDDDDMPEKYMGVFNLAKGRFLNFDRYKIRHNIDFLVPLRFIRRDDRLLGPSLLYDGMDIFQEINDIHRHRNNVRMITDAPGFVAEDDLKDTVEQALINWRPGVVVWVPKGRMSGIQQQQFTNPSNTQNSLDEENSLRGYVEFIIGPTQGLSGQETKGDAGAPATKHLSKIRQAGYRVDDYIDEFRRSFPQIGKLAMALYYQYGSRKMVYQTKNSESGDAIFSEADRALFGAEGINIELNARSVIMSPEFEMERIMALLQAAGVAIANPIEKTRIVGELWNRYVAASRAQDPEKLKVSSASPTGMPGMPGMLPGIPGPTPGMASGGTGAGGLPSLLASLGVGNVSERARS